MGVIRNCVRLTKAFQAKCITPQSWCRKQFYCTGYKDRFYTKKHEWVSVNGDIGTVGISSYAQEALGEVVYVQLPEIGKTVAAGDECGALESVKAASDIYSPVSGSITETNSQAESTPSIINKHCYGEGWLYRIKLLKQNEIKDLMDQRSYDQYLSSNDH